MKNPFYSVQNRELFARLQSGDSFARESIILLNRGIVFDVLKKLPQSQGSHHDDLVQEGMLALIRAVDKYDPSRAAGFCSYAHRSISHAMHQYVQRMCCTITLSEDLASLGSKFGSALGDCSDEDLRQMTNTELAQMLGWKVSDVAYGRELRTYMKGCGNEDVESDYQELVAMPYGFRADSALCTAEVYERLERVLARFSPRDVDVFRHMHADAFGCQPLTADELGERYGLTGARIRGLERAVRAALAREFELAPAA